MLASFLTVPAVILTPGSKTDSVGDPVDDWDVGVTAQATKIWAEPRRGGEDDDLRQMAELQVRLFFDTTVTVEAGCRVDFEDGLFEVKGPPMLRRTPRGPHHQEARCTAIVG